MTNLKVFQDKKELLKSLPALTASDFIIYDTSDQDETKPFVLISFSLKTNHLRLFIQINLHKVI